MAIDERYFTNSERSAMSCHQRWFWQYGLMLRPNEERKHFTRGNIWHAMLDKYFGSGYDSAIEELNSQISKAVDAVDCIFSSEHGPIEYSIEELEKLHVVLQRMIENYSKKYDSGQFEVLAIEAGVVADIGGPMKFGGKIDKIVRDTVDGRVYIMDHKTTTMGLDRWFEYNYYQPQMLGYAILARELGYSVDGLIHDAVRVPDIYPCVEQAPTKSGLLRKYSVNLPSCSAKSWLESMHKAGDHTEAAQGVYSRLVARESLSVDMERFIYRVTEKDTSRLESELKNVGSLLKVLDRPLVSAKEAMLHSFNEGGGSLSDEIRKQFSELAPSYPRNHGDCLKFGLCEYASVCRFGELANEGDMIVVDRNHTEM